MHKKILVVDSNELVLYGLERALKAEGVNVETAGTVSEAVLRLTSCKYDLCLVDLHLPDFSGTLLMTIIRDICPTLKVMIMTGSMVDNQGQSDGIDGATQNGTCHFMHKPFNLLELKDLVVQSLLNDDGVQTAFRYDGDRCVERGGRKKERIPFSEEARYSLTVIKNGESSRRLLLAQVIDVSRHGVGFQTEYPLHPSQVVSFEHDILCGAGVVVWSTMLDERSCRAGVQFC